jgi:hypothetical protein
MEILSTKSVSVSQIDVMVTPSSGTSVQGVVGLHMRWGGFHHLK